MITVILHFVCSVCGKIADDMFTCEDPDDVIEELEGAHYPIPSDWWSVKYCSEECYTKENGEVTGVWQA